MPPLLSSFFCPINTYKKVKISNQKYLKIMEKDYFFNVAMFCFIAFCIILQVFRAFGLCMCRAVSSVCVALCYIGALIGVELLSCH